jgi:hypothetical protein
VIDTMIWMVDAILLLVVAEAAVLVIYRQTTGSGVPLATLLTNLAAGFFLLVGIRVALSHPNGWLLPLVLLAAGLAHIADMALRWRRT